MDRAERRHRTRCVVERRKLVIKWVGLEDYYRGLPVLFGRCRTLAPLDCGRPHCGICSGNKRWFAGLTFQEICFKLSFKEQI